MQYNHRIMVSCTYKMIYAMHRSQVQLDCRRAPDELNPKA